ncbi:MAG: hypothetical protein LUP94_02510 [Candidatus Methanomethylicus sp.]|nr:hypothetical protein [Candidatus Methanomethylicus sp.]
MDAGATSQALFALASAGWGAAGGGGETAVCSGAGMVVDGDFGDWVAGAGDAVACGTELATSLASGVTTTVLSSGLSFLVTTCACDILQTPKVIQ